MLLVISIFEAALLQDCSFFFEFRLYGIRRDKLAWIRHSGWSLWARFRFTKTLLDIEVVSDKFTVKFLRQHSLLCRQTLCWCLSPRRTSCFDGASGRNRCVQDSWASCTGRPTRCLLILGPSRFIYRSMKSLLTKPHSEVWGEETVLAFQGCNSVAKRRRTRWQWLGWRSPGAV